MNGLSNFLGDSTTTFTGSGYSIFGYTFTSATY